jgi:protein TonB
MTLGPAKEPLPLAKSTAGTKAPIGGNKAAYRAKVWSALARHKPRVGKPGSTTVTFAIGAGGALGSVQVSRSSGNAELDRMAIQAVRNAAPFPPPPSGATFYTIQIYFR